MSVALTPPDQAPEILNPAVTQEELRRRGQNRSSRGYIMYPNDMDDSQDRIKFTALTYTNRNITATNIQINEPRFGLVRDVEPVFLPIQSGISDTNAVEWGSGELNEIQKRIANTSLDVMTTKDLSEEISRIIGNTMKGVKNDPTLGNIGRLYLVEQAVGVQGLISRATGSVLNPNLELLFKGPTLRPFQFQFKLSPRNSDEATDVKKIIKFFKQNMAVRRDAGNLFLHAPYVFGIQYYKGSNGNPHPSIGKIKECALQSCSVDYTPLGSYMTYNDSNATMVSYNISLQFQEIIPIYSEDYVLERDGQTLTDHSIGY